ncbi:hypothetical protein B0H13DRAFT_1902017 [Mycena leptocephala]|nr:hypothetical protein B0H13DRAFT_1902017 [Mycena leptocephala]
MECAAPALTCGTFTQCAGCALNVPGVRIRDNDSLSISAIQTLNSKKKVIPILAATWSDDRELETDTDIIACSARMMAQGYQLGLIVDSSYLPAAKGLAPPALINGKVQPENVMFQGALMAD